MEQCPNCKEMVPDVARFCPRCGTTLVDGRGAGAEKRVAVKERARGAGPDTAQTPQGTGSGDDGRSGFQRPSVPSGNIPGKSAPDAGSLNERRSFGDAHIPVFTYPDVRSDPYAAQIATLQNHFHIVRIVNIVASAIAILSLFLPWASFFGAGISYGDLLDSPLLFLIVLGCGVAVLMCSIKDRPALASLSSALLIILSFAFLVASGHDYLLADPDFGLFALFYSCVGVLVGAAVQRYELAKIGQLETERNGADRPRDSDVQTRRCVKMCSNCGTQVPPDANFCPRCGSSDFIIVPLKGPGGD